MGLGAARPVCEGVCGWPLQGAPAGTPGLVATRRNPLKTLFPCLGNRISQLVHTTLQTRAPEAALWPLGQSVRLPHQGSCASALGGGASDFGGTRATSLLPQELGNEPFGTLKCKRGDWGQTGGFLETSTGDVFSRQPSLGGDGVAEKWADGLNACL